MNYNGDSNETEIKGRIQTFVVFANTIFWQQPNTALINVVNGETKETYRNISLFTQWINLTNLVVVDTLQKPSSELYILFIPFDHNYFKVIIICKHTRTCTKAASFYINFS